MLPTDTLFAKPVSRLVCSLIAGAGAAFVLGSFIAFFVMFNSSAVEGQAAGSAKPTIFRVYAAIFLLVSLGFHLYASLTFRYSESKTVIFEFGAPRPLICAVVAGLLFIANVIPSSTEVKDDSKFEFADNPYIRESKFGWPGYFVTFHDEHGKKTTHLAVSLLLVNAAILLLAFANAATYDPTSRTGPTQEELDEEERQRKEKKKDKRADAPKDDWVPPQMAGGSEPPPPSTAKDPPKELEL